MKIILELIAVVLMLAAFLMYYVSLRTWKKEHPLLDRGAYWPPGDITTSGKDGVSIYINGVW